MLLFVFSMSLFIALGLIRITGAITLPRVAPHTVNRILSHNGILASAGWLAFMSCGRPPTAVPVQQTPAQESSEVSGFSRSLFPDEYGAATQPGYQRLILPSTYGKRTGDLDGMVRERAIRALVIIDPIDFFYLSGRPHGIQFESLQEFETFANQTLNTGKLPVHVVFLPIRPDQLEAALTQGFGDFIAHPVVITPEREQRVAFSVPLQTGVSQVVVTGSEMANVTSLDGFADKPIYANPLTTYYENLRKLRDKRLSNGQTPLDIRAADRNLYDGDLIQMVNAGLIPATVARRDRAHLWEQVLPNVKTHPELVIAREGETAWAMRKDSPHLKQLVDEFLKGHAAGTTFGNTLLRRYLHDTKWVRDSISPEELRKFIVYSDLFKKYSAEYNFDYLMIAAQGYQESQLDQTKRSSAGAVGIMQVIPKIAAASPINIPDIGNAGGNIHAGTKILRTIAVTHFNDHGIDPLDKTFFTFASYDAGPTRIAHLRKKAQGDGLDPNKWFENVELEVAQHVGEETVIYVGNVYKYYVAYRLTAGERKRRGLAASLLDSGRGPEDRLTQPTQVSGYGIAPVGLRIAQR